MKYMEIGKSKISVSRVGLGTWAIGGGPAWGDNDHRKSIATIRHCADIGVNLIDTAPAYNFGHSEEVLGEALQGIREKFALISKCGITWTNQGSFFIKVGETPLYKNLSKTSIKQDFELSLKRMNTDYIDIYMTHWQSVEPFFTPISETMEALLELKQEGKIKAIGAANVTAEHVKEYLKYGQLDLVQEKYSILDRKVEKEMMPLCKANGITLQAYSPLEQGLLTGTIAKDYIAPVGSARKGKKWFEPKNLVKAVAMIESWDGLCKKYNCTIANLAIAWILAQGNFINLLSGAVSMDEIEQNIKAVNIELSVEDIALLREMAEKLDK
ncbi:MAG: aldo/keto reductase [Firmicutes bacterium]|nr:aldo/keto reductase [Bacillota bacterium]